MRWSNRTVAPVTANVFPSCRTKKYDVRLPHQGVIDRLIAMGMKLADNVADDTGAFLEGGAGIEPQQPHRIEQPPVHRLEAVARVGQGAMHDGGERIGEIALLQRLAQADLLDVGRVGNQFFDS